MTDTLQSFHNSKTFHTVLSDYDKCTSAVLKLRNSLILPSSFKYLSNHVFHGEFIKKR